VGHPKNVKVGPAPKKSGSEKTRMPGQDLERGYLPTYPLASWKRVHEMKGCQDVLATGMHAKEFNLGNVENAR